LIRRNASVAWRCSNYETGMNIRKALDLGGT
jgi:hypothetical protein